MDLARKNGTIYEFDGFRLIPGEELLLRNGEPVPLNLKSFRVLMLLVGRHGHLVDKSEILDLVWADSFVEEGSLTKAIWVIRNALGDTSKEKFIQTIPRSGYRFVFPVSVLEGSGAFRLLDLSGIEDSDETPVSRNEKPLTNGSTGSGSVIETGMELPKASQPAVHAVMANFNSDRSRLARRTIGVLVLLTAAILLTYLFIPYAPFRTAEHLDRFPIADTHAAPNPVVYRPLAPAEDAYFKGLYYFDTATNAPKMSDKNELFSKAISELEKAVSIDPGYAEAYASLARAYHWLGSNGKREAYVRSKVAAMVAIDLDPSNAKAHASLAWVYWRLDWDWKRAEAEYKQTLALSGDATSTLGHGYALFISAQGRHEEAIVIMRRHEELSPLSIAGKMSSAYIKLRARKYDAAEVDFRRVLELEPTHAFALSGLAVTLACLDRFDEAIAVARQANANDDNPAQRLTLAWVHAKAGRVKDATTLLGKVERQFRGGSGIDALAVAKVYAGLRENDKAFAWLEKAFAVRSQYLVFLGVSPEFDNLKGDERFNEMLRRAGLVHE